MARRTGDMSTDPITGQHVDEASVIETKEFFRTSEFWVMFLTVLGVIVTALAVEAFDAPGAIRLITALSVAYIVSRGIAKAGSQHPFWGRSYPSFGRGAGGGYRDNDLEARLRRLEESRAR